MDEARAWNYCLWLLGRRAHSVMELKERMARKEASPETIGRVIARLEDYGFVDDRAFAGQFVESRSRRYGSLRLRGDLLRKGVAEELVDGQLAGLSDLSQQEVAARLLQQNAWRFTRGDDVRKNRARAWSFLARRGFPPGVAASAVEEWEALYGDGDGEE